MIAYTVILLVPDSIANAFGQDIFIAKEVVNQRAESLPRDVGVFAAIAAARDSAMDAYLCFEDSPVTAEDWHVLAVFPGHLENIKPESA